MATVASAEISVMSPELARQLLHKRVEILGDSEADVLAERFEVFVAAVDLRTSVSRCQIFIFGVPPYPSMARLLRAEYKGALALDYSYFERHWTTISADMERSGEKREHQE